MLTIAFPSVARQGDGRVTVGQISNDPAAGYLRHHWLPWLALLDEERLQLCSLDEALARRFVYPVELRWEFLEWFARGRASTFLTPHVPRAVVEAARCGKAMILLFYGHEGRLLRFNDLQNKGQRSAYDLINDFVIHEGLPPGAVWFVNGNLSGQSEFKNWKRERRRRWFRPAPFEVRFIEPFSYLAQLMADDRERGYETTAKWEATKLDGGFFLHRRTRLTRRRVTQRGDIWSKHEQQKFSLPPKLFLCMNRVTRDHRRTIVCHLLRRGYIERSLVSFRDDKPEEHHFDDPEFELAWQELQKIQPLTIDRDLPLDFENYASTNAAAVGLGEIWPYRNASFSIVTETLFTDEVLFVSEKVWKPIANCHPFIIVGNPGTLSYLRQLGFRTFHPFINESYDELVDNDRRMSALLEVIDTLGTLDDEQRAALLRRIRPILSHNARHLRQAELPMRSLLREIEARLGRA